LIQLKLRIFVLLKWYISIETCLSNKSMTRRNNKYLNDKYIFYSYTLIQNNNNRTFTGTLIHSPILFQLIWFNLILSTCASRCLHSPRTGDSWPISRLSVIYDANFVLSHVGLPFARGLYNGCFTSRVRSNFVCEQGKVFLVCAKNIDHLGTTAST